MSKQQQKGLYMKNQKQLLKDAFESLDEARVDSLLAQGADKSGRIRNEIMWKTFDNNKAPVLELLLKKGANPNYRKDDESYLGRTWWNGYGFDHKLTKVLLENGANPNIKTLGSTPLIRTAEGIDEYGTSGLRFLRKYGANVNAKNSDGMTPLLSIAAFYEIYDEDVFCDNTCWLTKPLVYLISEGADVNARDKNGMNALMHSYAHNENECDCLWETKEYKKRFERVFYYEIPTILMVYGADLRSKDKKGRTLFDFLNTDTKQNYFTKAVIKSANILMHRKNINEKIEKRKLYQTIEINTNIK